MNVKRAVSIKQCRVDAVMANLGCRNDVER
jgi:hypothetical protein